MNRTKFHKGDIVKFANKLHKITEVHKYRLTGTEYDLESVLPDEKTNMAELNFSMPEGFLTKG